MDGRWDDDGFLGRMAKAGPAMEFLHGEFLAAAAEYQNPDDGGTIRVVLAADGLPESIQVGADWRRAVGSEGFAAAVTGACRAAGEARWAAWAAALERKGLRPKLDEVMAYLSGNGPAPSFASTPSAPVASVAPVQAAPPHPVGERRREFDQLVNAMKDFDPDGDPPIVGTGTAARGRLSLAISFDRTVTCEADPGWVGEREADELTAALAVALAEARAGFPVNLLPDLAGPPADLSFFNMHDFR